MESVRDQVTDLHKDFDSVKSDLAKVSDQLLEVQASNTELQVQYAKVLEENVDLKLQVVSDGVNHITFSLNISLCSSLLSMIALPSSRSFSTARQQLVARVLHQQTLKEHLRRSLGLPSLSTKQGLLNQTRPLSPLLGNCRAWRSPLRVSTLQPETAMFRSCYRLSLRDHLQRALQVQLRIHLLGRAVKHRQDPISAN